MAIPEHMCERSSRFCVPCHCMKFAITSAIVELVAVGEHLREVPPFVCIERDFLIQFHTAIEHSIKNAAFFSVHVDRHIQRSTTFKRTDKEFDVFSVEIDRKTAIVPSRAASEHVVRVLYIGKNPICLNIRQNFDPAS